MGLVKTLFEVMQEVCLAVTDEVQRIRAVLSQESSLLAKLRSEDHATAATERLTLHRRTVASESVIREVRMLVNHRDDEARARAMCTTARLGKLDEPGVETAAMMMEDDLKHLASETRCKACIMPGDQRASSITVPA